MLVPFVLGAAAAAITYGIRHEEQEARRVARNLGCRCQAPLLAGGSLG